MKQQKSKTQTNQQKTMNDSKYITTPSAWEHRPKDSDDSMMTRIEIKDYGNDNYLAIYQPHGAIEHSCGGIAINAEEWPTLKLAIEHALEIASAGVDED